MKIVEPNWKETLVALLTFACVSSVEAGTKTWVGGAAGHLNDWNAAANWSPSGVPATADDVSVPSGLSNYPVLNSAAASAVHNVTVINGASLTLNSGGSLSGSGDPSIGGVLTIADGSLLMTNGNVALNGVLNLSSGMLSVSNFSGTGTANITGGTLQAANDILSTGLINMSGGVIKVGDKFHPSTANFMPTGGTVEFTGIGGQGSFPTGTYQFYNVLIDAGVNPGFDNHSTTIIVKGKWSNNGTVTLMGNTTVIFSGTNAQTISGASTTTFDNLTINNNAGVTLASPVTVDGTLTLSHGVLTTGSGLGFGSGSAIAGGSVSSYISGNVQKSVGVGNGQTLTFPVGSAAGFAPVTLSSLNVTAAGTLSITATAGEHPAISTSGIYSIKDANLYWTITPGSGLAVSSYSATFNFVSGELDAGANPLAFVVKRYSGSWSAPTTGPATVTNATATGLTAFGDFAVGEPAPSAPCKLVSCCKTAGNCMSVAFNGVANHTYTLQASVDLKNWVNIGSATAGTNGLCQYVDTDAGNYSARFYRTMY